MNDLLHSFPGQQSDEPVFVFARPDPLAFTPTALIFAVPLIFSILAEVVISNGFISSLPAQLIMVALAVLGIFQLMLLVGLFIAIMDFYLDIIVVTDRRLVDIDQEQLFSRRISELSLEEIEDVTSVVTGFFPSLFGYGTVLIQTAGTEDKFSMDNIRYPREVAALTLSLSEQAKQHIGEDGQRPCPRTNIIGVIHNHPVSTLDELRAIGAAPPTSPIPPNAAP